MASFTPLPTPLPVGRTAKLHYTVREVYEKLMWELNKVSAPSIDVETFNHFHNTARDNYYKRRYQLYDTGQLTTDQMRDMSATTVYNLATGQPFDVANQTFEYPPFYYHMLGITVFFKALADFRVHRQNDVFDVPCERTAADKLTMVRPDHYNRPQLNKTYFLERPTYVEVQSGKHALAVLDTIVATYLLLAEDTLLLQSDLDDMTTDPSQVLIEQGIVTLEVVKELVKLVLENQANQRMQTYVAASTAEPNQPPVAAPAAAPRR